MDGPSSGRRAHENDTLPVVMNVLRTIFFNLPALMAGAIGVLLAALACGMSMRLGRKLVVVCLCIALCLHVVVFFDASLAYVKFPYEGKSVVEGVVLYNAIKYLEGEQPYRPPEKAPFRSLVYPPVHEMALAGVVWLLGPSLPAGRIFSLLCTLGAALVVGLAVWRHTRNTLASCFGGIFFVCCYGVTGHWFEQVRNDALMCFLVALGLYLFQGAAERNRFPLGGLAVLLLALYTKQTAIFAPIAAAICLYLWNPRRALLWATSFIVGAAAVFIAMQMWSGGWFSFYVLRVPAAVGINLKKLDLASIFFGETWIALWGILAFAVPLLRAARSERAASLWTVAFLAALALCLLQSMKWGAALNAFAPLGLVMAVLAGFALHGLMRRFEQRDWLQMTILAAAVMQVAMISYKPILPTPTDRAAQGRIREWVRSAPGDVFVSVFSSQVYLNGKKYFGDNVPIGDLAKGGLWHGGELVETTRRGEFSLMILRPRIEPEDLAHAVQAAYIPVERIRMRKGIGGWPYMQVYVPKSAPWRPAANEFP